VFVWLRCADQIGLTAPSGRRIRAGSVRY